MGFPKTGSSSKLLTNVVVGGAAKNKELVSSLSLSLSQ